MNKHEHINEAMPENMTDDEREQSVWSRCGGYVVAFAVGVLLCWLLSCCTTTKVVTIERTQYDTTYVASHQRDSIFLHDSVYVKEWKADDTIFIYRTQLRDRWRERIVADTCLVTKIDSIPVPYEVVKEVQRKRGKTETWLLILGTFSLIAVVVFAANKLKKLLPW